MSQEKENKPRVWIVKCLRKSFVPHGALLLGPEISTDEQVVEMSAYQSALERIKELEELYKNTTPQRKHLLELKAKIAELEKDLERRTTWLDEQIELVQKHISKNNESKAREQKLVEALKIYADFETWNRGWDGETLPEDMAKRILKELGID